MPNQALKNLIGFTSGSLFASAVIYLLIAAVLATGLYFLGYKNGQANGLKQGQTLGNQAAEAKINAAPIGQADQLEVLRLSGEILTKSDSAAASQFLTVKTANLNRNPLNAPTPEQRKILLDSSTKIIKKVRKSAGQLARERFDYTEALKKNSEAILPPGTVDSAISFNDLTVGQTVKIYANSDVRNQAEFIAAEIDIFE